MLNNCWVKILQYNHKDMAMIKKEALMVDITINYKGKAIAGYAVKFAMRNYSQNSNNYFENMT